MLSQQDSTEAQVAGQRKAGSFGSGSAPLPFWSWLFWAQWLHVMVKGTQIDPNRLPKSSVET